MPAHLQFLMSMGCQYFSVLYKGENLHLPGLGWLIDRNLAAHHEIFPSTTQVLPERLLKYYKIL